MKIIADTATLFAPAEGEAQGMTIVPVCVSIDGKTYQDYAEITSEAFLEKIAAGGIPASSQPAIGDLLDVFEGSDEEMLVIFVAVRLSAGATAMACAAAAAAIGHCWPVFARFKGGKAVAALYGFLFGLFACGGYSIWFFLFPLLTFLLVLKCTRIISLSSMLSAAAVVFYAWFAGAPLSVTLALVFFAALIVIRHRPNLIRMYRHEENKVSWI